MLVNSGFILSEFHGGKWESTFSDAGFSSNRISYIRVKNYGGIMSVFDGKRDDGLHYKDNFNENKNIYLPRSLARTTP